LIRKLPRPRAGWRVLSSVFATSCAQTKDAIVVPTKPLENFPLVCSRDVDEVRSNLGRICSKPNLVLTSGHEGFDATINACRFPGFNLVYGAYGAAASFEFPASDAFCRLFPIRGRGETTWGRSSFALSTGAGAVVSAEISHRNNVSADYEHLVLGMNGRKLVAKLAAMTGATISEPLRMDPQQDFKHPAAQMLQQYIPLLVNTLSIAKSPFPDWWITQTEQLLMTLFLCGHRHNYSHLLEQEAPDGATLQVRRAEEYIAANVERAVTLEELAEVTGVSAFCLFRAFKKSRGYSPMTFASRLRQKLEGLP